MPSRTSPAELTGLVDLLRRDEHSDAAALDRVRERVAVTLTAAPIGLATNEQPTPSAPPSASGWLNGSTARALGTLAVGAALGAAGYALHLESKPAVVSVDQRAPLLPPPARSATAPPQPPPGLSLVEAPALASSRPPLPSRAKPTLHEPIAQPTEAVASQPARARDDFAAELKLLEQARTALSAGATERCLALLSQHAEHHARGALQQEREALRVKALAQSQRFGEARAAGEQFIAAHPNSSLLGSVQSTLKAIP
jgi:hypothetical protein